MKILTKLALASVILIAATSAQAEWVSGHFRSNGTYVAPYYRTPANGIPYDNLSYRGYPSQQPGYVAPRSWSFGSDLNQPRTMPYNSLSSPNHTYSYRNPYAAWSIHQHSATKACSERIEVCLDPVLLAWAWSRSLRWR